MLDPADLKIEETYRRSMLSVDRHSDGFVDLMADVNLIANNFRTEICRDSLFDLIDLQTQESHFIWFHIRSGNQRRELPYDFELVGELDPLLTRMIYQELVGDRYRLDAANQHILRSLGSSLEDPAYQAKRFDAFNQVRSSIERVNQCMKRARNFKGTHAELRSLRQSFGLPTQARLRLLLDRKLLDLPGHPDHAEVLTNFKNSYFKGSVDALDTSMVTLFFMLTQSEEQLAARTAEIADDPVGRTGHQPGDPRSLLRTANQLERGESATARYWLGLQRLPFTAVSKTWSAQVFRRQLDRLMAAPFNNSKAEKLATVFWSLQDKITNSCKKDSVIFTSLEDEVRLGVRTEGDYRKARAWVSSNRLKLAHLLYEVAEQLCQGRLDEPDVPLPEALTPVLAARATSASGTQLLDDISRQLAFDNERGRFEDILELDEGAATNLAEMLDLHRELAPKLQLARFEDLPWYLSWRRSCHDLIQAEEILTRVFSVSEELEALATRLETECNNCYQSLDRFSDLPQLDQETCRKSLIRTYLRGARGLNLEALYVHGYQARLDVALSEDDLEERLVQLDLLLQETEALPGAEAMKTVFQTWAADLGKEELEQPRRLFAMNLDDLKKLRTNIYTCLREAFQKGSTGNTQMRMRAFEVTAFSATDLSQILQGCLEQMPRISSVKQARGQALQLARLRERLLQAQRLYRPGKDRPEDMPTILDFELSPHIHRLLVEDLTENYQALKQLKRKTDKAYYEVRLQQERFGIKGKISHLELSLNLEDIETIQKQYGLKGDLCHEDLQRFGTSYLSRTGKTTELLDKLAMTLKKGAVSEIHQQLLALFSQADYQAYKKHLTCSAELKLALLYHFPEFYEVEGELLANFLNFASPGLMTKAKLFANYMELFKLIHQSNDRARLWIRRLSGNVNKLLYQHQPENHRANYAFNRDVFFREISRIVGKRLAK